MEDFLPVAPVLSAGRPTQQARLWGWHRFSTEAVHWYILCKHLWVRFAKTSILLKTAWQITFLLSRFCIESPRKSHGEKNFDTEESLW